MKIKFFILILGLSLLCSANANAQISIPSQSPRMEQIQARCSQARIAMNNKNYSEAIQILTDAVTLGNWGESWDLLAQAYMLNGEINKSIETYRWLIYPTGYLETNLPPVPKVKNWSSSDATDPEVLARFALVLLDAGLYDESLETYYSARSKLSNILHVKLNFPPRVYIGMTNSIPPQKILGTPTDLKNYRAALYLIRAVHAEETGTGSSLAFCLTARDIQPKFDWPHFYLCNLYKGNPATMKMALQEAQTTVALTSDSVLKTEAQEYIKTLTAQISGQ